jgi:Outer membrane protein beta-barrel domain
MTSTRKVIGAALLTIALAPAAAQADTLLIPFLGVNFGGDAGKSFSDSLDSSQFNWGVSIAFMGGGVFGVESDFAYSPDFYGKTDAGNSSVFTFTGNLVIGIPLGGQHGFGVRPYGVVGAGLMRSNADFGTSLAEANQNSFAWSAGGGIMVFFGDRFGLRGDFRYFRTLDDLEIFDVTVVDAAGKVDFTRTSLGFVFRF